MSDISSILTGFDNYILETILLLLLTIIVVGRSKK